MSLDQPIERSNDDLAFEVIQTCWDGGCREFVVCAGSRNSPLVMVLLELAELTADMKIWNFFEERSAAFFAMGRAKMSGLPCTVVTTSGTAVAELLPAVIESHYAGISMILVTADRPQSFRKSGSPQSIEQKGIMNPFTEITVDVSAGDSKVLRTLNERENANQRWHINVCFDEPLISESGIRSLDLSAVQVQAESDARPSIGEVDLLKRFIGSGESLVVLSGYLRPDQRGPAVAQWLRRIGCPIWAEASSGIREEKLLSDLIIRSGERYFSQNRPTKVLRIGDVPSLRFWRDLETFEEIEVISIDPPNFYSGLARGSQVIKCALSNVIDVCPVSGESGILALIEDRKDWNSLVRLLEKYPYSEPACVGRLSKQIPSKSLVFLGNSMPIREWNLTAGYDDRDLRCYTSRGANGIDGQCSTFLGLSANEEESWALFGDLTMLYDLSAPWVLDQLKNGKRRIVVINNGGGRIFSRLPHLADLSADKKRVTENHHQIHFEHWAAMWGLAYRLVGPADVLSMDDIEEQNSIVIELCPDLEQTELFWSEYSETGRPQIQ